MRGRAIVASLALALLGGAASGHIARATAAAAHHRPTTIQEDDPRWDCRTMGNHVCGPNGGLRFKPNATLDTSQIDDRRP